MGKERPVVVGIDIGTNKIATLVGSVESPTQIRILGMGLEPSQGIKRGVIVDLAAASQAVSRSIDRAERTSGMEIHSALVSLAGSNVSSMNSKGVVGVSGRVIDEDDVARAVDAARAVAIPHNREVIHVIQRGFNVDGQEGIRMPVGMHGYRLEVETHIITASTASVENLRQCVQAAGVDVSQFVLNPLAAGEVVLTETERQMGSVVCDLGGGTTDLAIYIDGDVWYANVIPYGGNHITSDIAQVLRLPVSQAEEIKLQHGMCDIQAGSEREYFTVRPFGEQDAVQVSQAELVEIINARVEEIFNMLVQEIKRSGYDGLLPAGMVLTGGCSQFPGIRQVASRVLGVPVRIGKPENLVGMTDQLDSPGFASSVGLLRWAMMMSEFNPGKRTPRPPRSDQRSMESGETGLRKLWEMIKVFLP